MPAPKLITCKVMVEELRQLLPPEISIESFEISQHARPDGLRATLQDAIDASDGLFDPILLGYGMCSKATVGLMARRSRLVVPKSDDCIAIFFGSREAFRSQTENKPGTYFLSQGWIGSNGGSVFNEYERMVSRFGKDRAERLMGKMLAHYERLAYIRTPQATSIDTDRAYAQRTARRFGMEYVELEGNDQWLQRMAAGIWGDDFVVVEPGEAITLEHFIGSRHPRAT